MRKSYLINICKGYKESKNKRFLESFDEIYNKYGVKTINIVIGPQKETPKDTKSIQTIHLPRTKVVQYIHGLKATVHINTFLEELANIVLQYRSELGQEMSKDFGMFTNKQKEREIMTKNCPHLIPKYTSIKREKLTSYKGQYPYIIKPIQGAWSCGVALIKNSGDLDLYNKNIEKIQEKTANETFLIEEYIQGPMYTITYFVNDIGEIRYDTFCKVQTGEVVEIDDFGLICRSITQYDHTDKEIMKDIESVTQEVVKKCGIKNTFIHQEIKKNKDGQYKIIELNARIGGYRLEMYKDALNRNIFDYVFAEKHKKKNIKTNVATFSILPKKSNILLEGFNTKTLDNINQLQSTTLVKTFKRYIGQTVGYTKHGYKRLGYICLANKNMEQFLKDYNTVIQEYKNLLILKK